MSLIAKPIFQVVPSSGLPRLDESSLAEFGCDVSFISDDSTSPEEMVRRHAEQTESEQTRRLMWDIFERIRAEYEIGEMIPHPACVVTRIRQSAAAMGAELDGEQSTLLFNTFDRVNKVMFQHQALSWMSDGDMKIHLHGRGWETHPGFARFARGAVEDDARRQAIWRASRINLAAGAYGAVNAHVMEGIAQGGFFLMRFCPADVIEKFYPPIAEFCAHWRITSNEELAELASPGIRSLMEFATRTLGIDPLTDWPDFVPHLLANRTSRPRSAGVLWPQYSQIVFSSRDELQGLLVKYLYDVPLRRQLADDMRRTLLGQMHNVRVSVNRRALTGASPQAA
jgi:hypothetical protein